MKPKRVTIGKVIFIIALILIVSIATLYFIANTKKISYCEKDGDCIKFQVFSKKYACANSEANENSLINNFLMFKYLIKYGTKLEPECVCENNFCKSK